MKIGELVRINEQNINQSYIPTTIEYIDTSSAQDGLIINKQLLPLNEAPSRAKRILRKNDILLSTVRPSLKHYAIIADPKLNTVASTGFAVITAKKIYHKYLYYFLTTPWYTEYLSTIAESQQSNFPAFNPSLIEKTDIPLPSSITQRKIAAILSSYDDLIKNNNSRIAILEKIAEELYREWFVRLRFPGHEKVKLVKGVPEGWEVKRIGDVFNTASGGTPSRSDSSNYQGDINWFKTGELKRIYVFDSEEKITQNGLDSSSAKIFSAGTVVMAMYCAMADISMLANDGSTNQACCAFFSKDESISSAFTYYLIKYALPHMIAFAHGAAQQNLSQELIKSHKIFLPEHALIGMFTSRVAPMHATIKALLKKNILLVTTRDRLLSRLMSGKIDVEKMDIQFPPSMPEEAVSA